MYNIMEDENSHVEKLQDWSFEDDQELLFDDESKTTKSDGIKHFSDPDENKTSNNQNEELSYHGLTNETGLLNLSGLILGGENVNYTEQILELSDDENEPLHNTVFDDTFAFGNDEQNDNVKEFDNDEPIGDLERNPLDGLPYSSLYYELLEARKKLPIWRAKDDFVMAMDESPIVLVTGKAGTGKSTQRLITTEKLILMKTFSSCSTAALGDLVFKDYLQRYYLQCSIVLLQLAMADQPLVGPTLLRRHLYALYQIPQWCVHFAKELNFSMGTVLCSQPNSLAAVSLATQVAREMDLTSIGNEVGYKVPFAECCGEETILKFVTDRCILREMTQDPLLEKYGVIILDEVQQRTVATDILLALLRIIVYNHRDTLRLVVISLPHEMPKFEEFFDGVPVVDLSYLDEISPGQSPSPETGAQTTKFENKKDLFYSVGGNISSTYIDEAVNIAIRNHCDQQLTGDFLIFMPSKTEINEVCEMIAREVAMKSLRGEAGEADVIALHNGLPMEPPRNLYEKPTDINENSDCNLIQRKIIVTDGVAESSFSMNNIYVVIDSGRILVNNMAETSPPDFHRSELTGDVLLMKRLLQQLGVTFYDCQLLDPPAPEAYMQALEDLDYHGALDDNGELSDLGAVMSELPLSLRLAKTVIASCGECCTEEVISLVSMLSSPDCFARQMSLAMKKNSVSTNKFANEKGDHFTLINVYNEFLLHRQAEKWCKDNNLNFYSLKIAQRFRDELSQTMDKLELPKSPPIKDKREMELSVIRALLAGFFMQIGKDTDGSGNYLIIRDKHVARLNPSTHVSGFPDWVLFNEFVLSDNSYLHTVTEITEELIAEIAPLSYLSNLPDSEIKTGLINKARDAQSKLRENEATNQNAETSKQKPTTTNHNPQYPGKIEPIHKNTALPVTSQQSTNFTKIYHPHRNALLDHVHELPSNTQSKNRRRLGDPKNAQTFRDYHKTKYSSHEEKSGESVREQSITRGKLEVNCISNADDNGDINILTQTARELTHAYHQAANYYNNSTAEENCEIM